MRVLVFLLILLVTNLITFGYSYNRCKVEKTALQSQLAATIQEGDKLYARYKSSQDELNRLRGWNNFVELQKQLNPIVSEIDRLNFGTGIQQINTLAENIRNGKYGQEVQAKQTDLLAELQQCREKLEQKDNFGALTLISEFNRRVLQVFTGVAPAPLEPTVQTAPSQTQTSPIPTPE
jgi:hypothetical protein